MSFYTGFNFGGGPVERYCTPGRAQRKQPWQRLLHYQDSSILSRKGLDMKLNTAFIAALAGVFAVTAAAPSFAAVSPAKKEKRLERMIKRADLNGDGKISEAEMARGLAVTFARLDVNNDGKLSKSEIAGARAVMKTERKRAKASGEGRLQFMKFPAKRVNKNFSRIDANGDGAISKAELDNVAQRMFSKRDKNRDGYITKADFVR